VTFLRVQERVFRQKFLLCSGFFAHLTYEYTQNKRSYNRSREEETEEEDKEEEKQEHRDVFALLLLDFDDFNTFQTFLLSWWSGKSILLLF
jgi:hypothetical protein